MILEYNTMPLSTLRTILGVKLKKKLSFFFEIYHDPNDPISKVVNENGRKLQNQRNISTGGT